MPEMTDIEFEHLAEQALTAIERALEASGADVDIDIKEGGVLELEFPDRSRIVVNRHAAAREIWVAAKGGGYHFRWANGRWCDTRDGGELFASLSRQVTAQWGSPVILSPGLPSGE